MTRRVLQSHSASCDTTPATGITQPLHTPTADSHMPNGCAATRSYLNTVRIPTPCFAYALLLLAVRAGHWPVWYTGLCAHDAQPGSQQGSAGQLLLCHALLSNPWMISAPCSNGRSTMCRHPTQDRMMRIVACYSPSRPAPVGQQADVPHL
jgi:hypothetical protein